MVIAAVVALLTTRLLSPGANTLYDVHLSEMLTAVDYFLIVGVGLLAGLCGPLLMWPNGFQPFSFSASQTLTTVAAGAGGLIVGCVAAADAEGMGNGYSVVQAFLQSPPLLSVIPALMEVDECPTLNTSYSLSPRTGTGAGRLSDGWCRFCRGVRSKFHEASNT